MFKTKVFIIITLKKITANISLITGQMVSLKKTLMSDTKLLNIEQTILEENAKTCG